MMWNGIVSSDGQNTIAATLTTTRSIQATPRPLRGPSRPSAGVLRLADREPISLTPHRGDEVVAELRAQSPHAHADDVRAGLELIPPHRREELPLGHRLAGVVHQLAQHEELKPGKRDGAPA